jgi:ribosomal protein L35AE/L33A
MNTNKHMAPGMRITYKGRATGTIYNGRIVAILDSGTIRVRLDGSGWEVPVGPEDVTRWGHE